MVCTMAGPECWSRACPCDALTFLTCVTQPCTVSAPHRAPSLLPPVTCRRCGSWWLFPVNGTSPLSLILKKMCLSLKEPGHLFLRLSKWSIRSWQQLSALVFTKRMVSSQAAQSSSFGMSFLCKEVTILEHPSWICPLRSLSCSQWPGCLIRTWVISTQTGGSRTQTTSWAGSAASGEAQARGCALRCVPLDR